MTRTCIGGTIVDIHARRMFPGVVTVEGERIVAIEEVSQAPSEQYIMPGLVDAHVHIESSMLIPSEFARLAVVHGTVATVSDPHEIGNVCGIDGVRYMIDNAARVPFTVAFGAPSCVPATTFETAGAEITAEDIRQLFQDPRVRYLSEMMNWPGVLHADPVVMEKLEIARTNGRVIDGHAPGLRGEDARRYAENGIGTDHECFTLQEALDKIDFGMKILIREGSAARNYDALHPLLKLHPDRVMFCTDDMHPDALVVGHIDSLVRRSIIHGYEFFDVLRAASLNPVEHYGLDVGLLRVGDRADFIVVDSPEAFRVKQTWIAGTCVARDATSLITRVVERPINRFSRSPIGPSEIKGVSDGSIVRAIVAHDGQLVTSEQHVQIPADDVLKLVVVNRYTDAPVAVAYIRGFGLSTGALASTVAHDSHNIIAVGCSDDDIVEAVNTVIRSRGGISATCRGTTRVLELPVAGLMSTDDGYAVAQAYTEIDSMAKQMGSTLRAPFMTLSFMALLVIPQLKLSDRGLFDGEGFTFTSLTVS